MASHGEFTREGGEGEGEGERGGWRVRHGGCRRGRSVRAAPLVQSASLCVKMPEESRKEDGEGKREKWENFQNMKISGKKNKR
jgi:hypothetical protein